MKIKRKVQKNLPQLIEWAWDNGIKNKEYPCDGFEDKTVIFNGIGWAEFSDEYSYNKTDFFAVEVEEEITEDTVIPILIERQDFGNELTYSRYEYVRIKDIKEESSTLFYIENDDLTMTLIWTREKGLVE